jgi:glyoxylase-like metal-dependent hydrolase (beta-lactamase superfamily II)
MSLFEYQSIGERCGLSYFETPFPIYSFLIFGDKRTYVVDTHLGPDTASKIRDFVLELAPGKSIAVINSHAHWDHVWGNCAFPGAPVISHERCPQIMKSTWQYAMSEYGDSKRGEVTMVLPSLTFSDRMTFLDDGVELFHTPGHTEDSIAIYYKPEGVMFVADTLEEPIPQVDSSSPSVYADSLLRIATYSPETIATGHNGIVPSSLLHETVAYLKYLHASLHGEKTDYVLTDDKKIDKHEINRRLVTLNRMEDFGREKLGFRFDLDKHLSVGAELFEKEPAEIEAKFRKLYGAD